MPMNQTTPRLVPAFLGCLLLLNLVQAAFTELLYDEAYYWYYAQNISWGYFDHPPMVAWMIALGSNLIPGELGVRVVSVLMGIGTLFLLWLLIDAPGKRENPARVLLWFLSITLLHAYGFLSLPDTPLLFFTALFLLAYRYFLRSPGMVPAVGLGLVMAALMYSKYHAALVILFVLLSNLKLLRSGYAWLALAVSLLAYFPHLYWLYEQEFVSVRYHLFERPNQPYSFSKFTAGYFLNLIALFGLTFPWAYLSLWKYRPTDTFRRSLKFVAWGIFLFFLFSSFQANGSPGPPSPTSPYCFSSVSAWPMNPCSRCLLKPTGTKPGWPACRKWPTGTRWCSKTPTARLPCTVFTPGRRPLA